MAAAGSQISLVYLGAKYIYCTRSSLKGNFIYSPLVELGTDAQVTEENDQLQYGNTLK